MGGAAACHPHPEVSGRNEVHGALGASLDHYLSARTCLAAGWEPVFWLSPDIWSDPPVPVRGGSATVTARVHNLTGSTVNGVTVQIWYTDPRITLEFPAPALTADFDVFVTPRRLRRRSGAGRSTNVALELGFDGHWIDPGGRDRVFVDTRLGLKLLL